MTNLDTSVKITMVVMADNYKNGHEWDHLDALACRKASEVITALEAENETLRGLVQGWHYLAVGPDEMGDYYTHKQLIKASAPYASPALAALETKHD